MLTSNRSVVVAPFDKVPLVVLSRLLNTVLMRVCFLMLMDLSIWARN